MTNEQLLMYAQLSISHFKSIRDAINHKARNMLDLERNQITSNTQAEIIAAHDALILDLYNTIPTEQDAIDTIGISE